MLESVSLVKRAICTLILPLVNTSSPGPLVYSVVTFCKSNNTVLEVSLYTLNQVRVRVSLWLHESAKCHQHSATMHSSHTTSYLISRFFSLASGCQILTELMQKKTDEMVTVFGMAVMMIDQMQNQTSLWESLLALPWLFTQGSVDQVLGSADVLLVNIQGYVHDGAVQSERAAAA